MVHRTGSAGRIEGRIGQPSPGNADVCRRTPNGAFVEKILRSNLCLFLPPARATAALAMTAVPSVHAIYLKPLRQPLTL
jgi:hypothetical protein